MAKLRGEWQIFRSRYIPSVLPIVSYWSWPISNFIGTTLNEIKVNIWDKGNYQGAGLASRSKIIGEFALHYFQKHLNCLERVRTDGFRAGQKVVEHCRNFARKASKASVKEVADFLKETDKLYNLFTQKSMILWIFTAEVVQAELEKQLQNHSREEQQEIWRIMSISTISSYSQKEEAEFEALVALARQAGVDTLKVRKKIKIFSKKYFWFPWEYVGPDVWDEKVVRTRVLDELQKSAKESKKENIKKMQAVCCQRYNLSKEVVDLFAILQTITLMQDDRKMLNAQVCYYLHGVIFVHLAERLGLIIEQMQYIDLETMQQFVETKNISWLRNELDARQDFLVIVQNGYKNEAYTGDAGRRKLRELGLPREEVKHLTELRGITANKGIARGPARVLKTSNGVTDFKDGSILVTGMTTPDFVPLMKKAAAIVTDEGGITSHAAIISRELGIPCIVGTKIATQIFKNGDVVEVDAEKGIIRKLTKTI